MDFCFTVFHDFNSVKPLFENVKRGVRRMNLKILLSLQEIHSEVDAPREHIEFDQVIALCG
jgi:hypothetical protein